MLLVTELEAQFPFTGQAIIGSGTQSDLLMMGIKMPQTCCNTIDYQ